MRAQASAPGDGDIGSTAAFSVLFVLPAALAVSLWVLAGAVHLHVAPVVALLGVAASAVLSAAVASWACRRAGARSATVWGFAIGAAVMTIFFMGVAAAWFVPVGD